ncbi:RDD family protein [Actinomadura sp. SCN-SB]|uniref:RDD family protein n=1 Tax=Actinomadura sp. SCN-SB TaxID=3373092 RepID=UPI0037527703
MAAADQAPKADPLPEIPGEGPAGLRLAEPGQRLLARIVDTLVVGLPVIMVLREVVPAGDVEIAAPPAVAGLLLLYEWVQLVLWGRTLGKRVAGIHVVPSPPHAVSQGPESDGEAIASAPLGVGRSLLRSAVYALPIAARPVPVFGLIAGLLWVGNAALMYEGTWRQALHDRLSGTVVVRRGAA